MTLTQRLTVLILVWCTVILAVFNVVSFLWFESHELSSLRQTVSLELRDVSKLASAIPHLALRDDWDQSNLLISSAIRFFDASGQVTSFVASPGFPTQALPTADAFWKQHFDASTGSTNPSGIAGHAAPSTGGPPNTPYVSGGQPTSSIHQLPQFTGHGVGIIGGLVAAEEPFVYPDGSTGRVMVVADETSFISDIKGFVVALLTGDAVVLALLGVGTYLVAERGVRPIRTLMDDLRGVEWELSSRLKPATSPSEVAQLADTINQLLDRVEEGVQKQQEFVSNASHELRTPLSIIAGHANLLRRWGNSRDEVWEPAVSHIVAEVSRLQTLINRLLQLSTVQEQLGPTSVEAETAQLMRVVEELRDDGRLLRPDLEWHSACTDSYGKKVRLDPDDLRQVLVILMDNAMQHTPAGGSVELLFYADDHSIRCVVRDTGEGIPDEVQSKVFDRFYRIPATRTQRREGAGLGLSICHELVQLYGGRITLQSKVGVGTTVTVTIPVTKRIVTAVEGVEN